MSSMFNGFLSITVWSSIIILAILIIRRLCSHKISASFFRLAWICLAIRIILPFDISLPTAPITVSVLPVIYVNSAPAPTVIVSGNEHNNAINAPIIKDTKPVKPQISLTSVLLAVNTALPIIWLLGAAIYFTTGLASYLLFTINLRKSREKASQRLTNLCDTLDVYASPLVSSPILCGYFQPTVYVSCKEYTKQEEENIALHEMMHYKQGDLWVQLLLLGAVSLSWFNPLVHIMRRKAICDIEMNVDEKLLINATKEQRLEYGKMLFAEISIKEGLLLAQYNSGKSVKERFKAIITTATKSRGRLLLCIILTVCVGASLLVSYVPKAKAESTPPEPTISAPSASDVSSQNEDSSQPISTPQSEVNADLQSVANPSSQNSTEFSLPIKEAFTSNRGPSNGHTNSFDLAAPKGTPIHAVLGGIVTVAWKFDDKTFTDDDYTEKMWAFGNHVTIDHGNGLQTLYAHCDEIKVKSGDEVKAGDVIATVGSTGRSSGNHVHLNFSTMDKEVVLKGLSAQAAKELEEFLYIYESAEHFTEWDEYVKEAQKNDETAEKYTKVE